MEKLGIQPIQLLAQVFNFLILMILLKKYLYKPILKMLEDRKKQIEAGLRTRKAAKQKLEAAEKKKADIINKAKLEAGQILEEAKKIGKKLEKDIIEKAEKQAVEVIKKGKKELELERVQMEKQLQKQTVDIAMAMVEKVLQQSLTDQDQQTIINKKLKDFAKLTK